MHRALHLGCIAAREKPISKPSSLALKLLEDDNSLSQHYGTIDHFLWLSRGFHTRPNRATRCLLGFCVTMRRQRERILHPLDLAVVIAYVALITYVGIRFNQRVKTAKTFSCRPFTGLVGYWTVDHWHER